MIVSFCVVARNEQEYLPRLFEDICTQTYPHLLMEIILVNSMSTDRTRELMEQFKAENKDFKNILVVDNPKKNQASGWNIAIGKSSGDIIIRIDAHASIPNDFVQKNVDSIKSGENISGGPRPCIVDKETQWKRTLLLAENSMFGSSFASYRRVTGKSYVKSIFHASYRREVFESIGGFNEYLGRTEDNEIHYRMRKAGYRLCFDPDIVSYQFIRTNLKKMIKQKFANGYWIGLTVGVCPQCLSIYHFIPFAFIIGIILTAILTKFGFPIFAQLMWGIYMLMALFMTGLAIDKKKFNISQLLLPIIFFLLHVSYGLGTIIGLLRMPFWRVDKNQYPYI